MSVVGFDDAPILPSASPTEESGGAFRSISSAKPTHLTNPSKIPAATEATFAPGVYPFVEC
jgi:hypothetical protein